MALNEKKHPCTRVGLSFSLRVLGFLVVLAQGAFPGMTRIPQWVAWRVGGGNPNLGE